MERILNKSNKDRKVDLILDSGIFSAWNRRESLDIKTYIKYVKRNQSWLHSYVNMDVIPGVWGKPRTKADVQKSAEGSYKNQQTMKDAGLRPIPVFHQGEEFTWLERLIADGEDYIGISTAKDIWAREQQRWLDEVFSMITTNKGRPLVRTHGFGITRPALLFRYPWFTTDSTTWSLTPGYGIIMVPPLGRNGEFNYLEPPTRIVVSGVVQKGGQQKMQFEGLGPIRQAHITRFLHDEIGINITDARYGTTSRRRAVLTYYIKLCERMQDVYFSNRRGQAHTSLRGNPPIKKFKFNIMYATCLNREWSSLMTDLGARSRLLSYYELKDKPDDVLQSYVATGLHNGAYEKYAPKQSWESETYLNHRRLALAARTYGGDIE